MSIDIATLQKDIKEIEQIVDKVDKLVPGKAGDVLRNIVAKAEKIAENPVVVEAVVVLANLALAGGKLDKTAILKMLEEIFVRHGL